MGWHSRAQSMLNWLTINTGCVFFLLLLFLFLSFGASHFSARNRPACGVHERQYLIVQLQLAESLTPVGSPALSFTRAHVQARTLAAEHHERQLLRKRFDQGG